MTRLLALLALLCATAPALAGDITLAWDAVTGATGYKLYCGSASKTYGAPVDVKNVTTYKLTLPAGTDRFCAVTAYDASSESGYSNEVTFHVPPAAPTNLRVSVIVSIQINDQAPVVARVEQ